MIILKMFSYYEISEEREQQQQQLVDEVCLVKYLKSNELTNSFYIVNERKNMIIVSKNKTGEIFFLSSLKSTCLSTELILIIENAQIQEFINEYKDIKFNQVQLPFSVSLQHNKILKKN
jgi:hypothetical protein